MDKFISEGATSLDYRLYIINLILDGLEYDEICEIHHYLTHKYGKRNGY